jgi:hypothetical protein
MLAAMPQRQSVLWHAVLCRWLVVSKGATALHVAALQQHASVVLAILQHYALLLRDWLPVDSSSRRPVDPRSW